jgi:small subunit ribosomal protein S3
MGQKTHPLGFRLGLGENWRSRWFAPPPHYGPLALEDVKIRRFLAKEAGTAAGVHAIEIEREAEKVKVVLQVSRPGVIIGRGGTNLARLREGLHNLLGKKVDLVVEEIKSPEFSAKIMGEEIVRQIKQRMPIRRVMNRTAERILARGAKGVKIIVSGVLSGPSSISRQEKVARGSIPGQTLRAKIDFARVTAFTSYGTIGVKVWIYLGET